jgi:NAD(P)H-dependent FMN reductase
MAETWLVLDAFGDARGGDAVRRALHDRAEGLGNGLEVMRLDATAVAPCRGCFGCWTKTPGVCVHDDAAREITAKLARADVLVVLTPIVLGGYAPLLKTAVDRGVLPTLLPHFEQAHGRTRHFARYAKTPILVAIGLLPGVDADMEQIFCGVVARNAANMRSPAHTCAVAYADMAEDVVAAVVANALHFGKETVPASRRIVLLCGSPKKKHSVSHGFAVYADKILGAAGAEVASFDLLDASRDEEAFTELAAAVDEADGAWLFSPLYADQLPGHAQAALMRLHAWRKEVPPRKSQRFSAVINCGFPESVNNDAALAMCRLFARQAGFAWLGGCAVGGGGFYEGRPLEAFGWFGRKARAAIARKAQLFVDARMPDIAATGDIAVPCPVPARLYLLLAEMGWKKALGGKNGMRDSHARPYARQAS